jgi:hypothetical protein
VKFNFFGWASRKADKFAKTIASYAPPRQLRSLTTATEAPTDLRERDLTRERLKIRFAQTSDALEDATMLVQKRYAWRGYPPAQLKPNPNRITITTSHGSRVIGTVTVGYDSEAGLLADEIYKTEIDQLRARGCVVGELSKLAIDKELGGKQVLARIVHIAYLYGLLHQCTDAVIEVVPRHKAFYERMLGFTQLGPEKLNPRVNKPVLLMHMPMAEMAERIRALGGRGATTGNRSLYPYFFSQREQDEIIARLTQGE